MNLPGRLELISTGLDLGSSLKEVLMTNIVNIAISLDGYIGDTEGGLD